MSCMRLSNLPAVACEGATPPAGPEVVDEEGSSVAMVAPGPKGSTSANKALEEGVNEVALGFTTLKAN